MYIQHLDTWLNSSRTRYSGLLWTASTKNFQSLQWPLRHQPSPYPQVKLNNINISLNKFSKIFVLTENIHLLHLLNTNSPYYSPNKKSHILHTLSKATSSMRQSPYSPYKQFIRLPPSYTSQYGDLLQLT